MSKQSSRVEIVSARKKRFGPSVSTIAWTSVLSPLPASALEVWRYPDGSNPLEALFAGPSPIPGITGELTGVWFGDLFAYMNLILLLGLLAFSGKLAEETEGKDKDGGTD